MLPDGLRKLKAKMLAKNTDQLPHVKTINPSIFITMSISLIIFY